MSDYDSEDMDDNDEGATTPCGQPAAMDSAPAQKATSPKQLRNHSNQNSGPEAKKTRSKRGYETVSNSEDADAKDSGAAT